jgi:putative transposase
MKVVERLAETVGVKIFCERLAFPRDSFYRRPGLPDKKGQRKPKDRPLKDNPRALRHAEGQTVLDLILSKRFVDTTPETVYATLLDEGSCLCLPRTVCRILANNNEVREHRNQPLRPNYARPELNSSSQYDVWARDITKLIGSTKWADYCLCVILDIYSRYVVCWMIARAERTVLAKRPIEETCAKQAIKPSQMTIHADRDSSMTSKPVGFLLADLGITKTHNRPYTSNGNPISESQLKTFKYSPRLPICFEFDNPARDLPTVIFGCYNLRDRHSGIGCLTFYVVHHGLAVLFLAYRSLVLDDAHQAHPECFVRGKPGFARLPKTVYINPPQSPGSITEECEGVH